MTMRLQSQRDGNIGNSEKDVAAPAPTTDFPGRQIQFRHRAQPETAIHRAVVAHLRTRGVPGLVWWHTPNGGRRNRIEGAILNGLGVRPGVADLIFLYDGRAFALELKTDAGRPTIAQRQFVSDFNAAGGTAVITNGLDQALRTIEHWRLLYGRVA
jgi:hypothetical protein